jgi:hypothetical protein
MKRLCILMLVLLASRPLLADEYYWRSTTIGPGGDGVSFMDGLNWAVNNVQATNPPGNLDNAKVFAAVWMPNWPILSDNAVVGGVYLGLDTTGNEGEAFLDITAIASLTTVADDGWNDGVQIAWYSPATLTSAGTVDTGTGWTNIGNAGGDGTLHITGGSWTTSHVLYGNAGTGYNHIQLDGGTLTTNGITGLHLTNHTLDITEGQLVLAGDVRSSVSSWIATGNLTAYDGNSTVCYSFNQLHPNMTTVKSYTEGSECDDIPVDNGDAGILGDPNWWDNLTRIVQTSNLQSAVAHKANVMFNGSATDPGWGVYGQKLTEYPSIKEAADAAGMKSISYYETFGDSTCFVGELSNPSWGSDYNSLDHTFWSWQLYSGGETIWVGVHNWFDDEDFARPWTRTHPVYGGPPMRYPDDTIATGYNGDPNDPRNSRVYDAGSTKDILGNIAFWYGYNADTQPIGQLYIPETGKYSGYIAVTKDAACPMWIDYTYASALYSTESGFHGMWTDNFSAWDNVFLLPVERAFGEWSVALFRDYLTNNFTPSELSAMGVTNVATFDIRTKLKNIATGWGWDGSNLHHAAWDDSRWQNEDIWNAYLIYKRQTGTEALSNYSDAVHQAATENGTDDFLIMGNDIPIFSLGWVRGNLDMVSTEISAAHNLCSGSRGFMLPPVGRIGPAYKAGREHSISRFVNVWFYNSGYEDYLKHDPPTYEANTNACWVLYSEMLATNTMPMIHTDNPMNTGSPEINTDFFDFVSQVDTLFSKRYAVEDVGIYYSSSSLLNQILPGGVLDFDNQPHQFANWGWATALGHLHYQYRFVPEWKLDSDTLNDLRVLIIPESEVFDDADAVNILLPWVQAGGRLIVTGVSGNRHGEYGNFAVNSSGYSLAPLTGVSNISSAPSAELRIVGAGKVYYIKNNIGMDYFHASTVSARASQISNFSSAMNLVLSGTDPVVLTSTDPDVDENVGLTLYEDILNGKLFVDIVNYDLVLATDQITNTPPLTFDIVKPSWLENKDITVDIVSPDAVGSVNIDLNSVPGRIQITTPSIKYYASIIIEFQLDANIDDSDSEVNLKDFARLASKWMHSPCYAENNWCDESDINLNNKVDFEDLMEIISNWLETF